MEKEVETIEKEVKEDGTITEETKPEVVVEIKPETKEEKKEIEEIKEAVFELSFEDDKNLKLETIKDGRYKLTLDKEDPNSSYYIFKNPQELVEKLAKAKLEADKALRVKSAENITRKTKAITQEETPIEKVEFPNEDKILKENLVKRGVDPKYLSYTKEEWRAVENEDGVSTILDIRDAIREAKEETRNIVSKGNAVALNGMAVQESTEVIISELVDNKISEDDFDYEAVLERVRSNPENFKPGGVLKNGVIVKEANKEINKILRERVKKEIDDEHLETEEKKEKLPTKKETVKKFEKPSLKNYNNMNDVFSDLVKEVKSGKRII